ncbi:MAG: hypothetical protein ACRC1K_13540, partial [Planctomycetia bacterium]
SVGATDMIRKTLAESEAKLEATKKRIAEMQAKVEQQSAELQSVVPTVPKLPEPPPPPPLPPPLSGMQLRAEVLQTFGYTNPTNATPTTNAPEWQDWLGRPPGC